MRLWLLFTLARLLRVPIDIHGSFWASPKASIKRIKVADLLREADECAKAIERLRQSMNQNINLPQAMPKQSFTF